MQDRPTSFETTVFGWDASTGDAINCPILVFDVGLNQLCDMFGLNGHEKSFNPWNGILYPFHVSVGDYVVIDTTTICGVMLGYSYLMFAGSDLQYARHYLANMITEDTKYESIHQYEIWHVCDDDALWSEWNTKVIIQQSVSRNIEREVLCAYCGKPLSKPYQYAIDILGSVERVCRDCSYWDSVRQDFSQTYELSQMMSNGYINLLVGSQNSEVC